MMDNVANGESQNFQGSSAGLPVDSSPAQQSSGASERTFKQSEVNELVGRARSEAIDRYKRETSRASHNEVQHQSHQPNYQPNYVNNSYQQQSEYNGLSREEYKRMIAEEIQSQHQSLLADNKRQQEEQHAQRIANEFLTKIESGKSKYPDLDKKIYESQLGDFPNIVQLVNLVDNTDDVVYELTSNPMKIAQLQQLVDVALNNGREPVLAFNELKKLSQSIKDNQKATQFKSPNEPLSQLRHSSNAGTDNGGRLTASDYRKRGGIYRV